MLIQIVGVKNKEHYGMLWYFLEWSINHTSQRKDKSNKSEVHVCKDIRTQVKFDAVYYDLKSSALFRQKLKLLKPVDEKEKYTFPQSFLLIISLGKKEA